MSEIYDVLAGGGVAILQTDTVYGLAALPGSRGYDEIFALKKRPAEQALPWLVSGVEALAAYADSPSEYTLRLAETFWPGALTLVVRASKAAIELGGVADDGSLALRCPDRRELIELMQRLERPLACTSANEHGATDTMLPSLLPARMLELPGAASLEPLAVGTSASSIVDCTGDCPRILREGPIPSRVLLDVAIYGATLVGRAATREHDAKNQKG